METLNLAELRQQAYEPCAHQISPSEQATFATCPSCAAEAKGRGGDHATWSRARATAMLDAGLPPRYRDALPTADVAAWAGAYATDPDVTDSLLLVGVTGVGKSYQAYGALRVAMTLRPGTWKATTYADFTASLRPNAKDPDAALKTLREADMLLLDDLGTAKHTEWVEEITYRLLNARYEAMKPSIFTTNIPLTQLREAVGDRIASRLVETTTIVPMLGDDRRRRNVAKNVVAAVSGE